MYRIVKELANYTIYDVAEAYFDINIIDELEVLISQFSKSDLNAYEYLHIKEKVNLTDAKKAIDKTIKFLYKQKLEFDNANKELKILKKLHKKVKLLIVNNFKQLVFHYFQYNNNV
uniref:Uncharacterized protein n=1 Tax=Rhizophagus irregularis (strain DAOM 181602 / DAOM 197198 / MUCL 43194) TaxID=747089 RepID=U9TAF0_RHIID